MTHRLPGSLVMLMMVLTGLAGCASYATPGPAADFQAMGIDGAQAGGDARDALTDHAVRLQFQKQPLAQFPTAIAVARVQGSQYHNHRVHSWGHGKFSVVTERDVETDEHFARIAGLPQVKGLATMNRLLLPEHLRSELDLRQAAAALHADMLLVYTLDTRFHLHDHVEALTKLTLGLLPNREARVRCTAAAVLLDTRTGYVYGAAESTARHTQLANLWTTTDAVDQSRRKVERDAFNQLVDEMQTLWPRILQQQQIETTTASEQM
jgi:hypothetical protein